MTSVQENIRNSNPYKRGADDGLIMGGLLIVMFLAAVFSVESAFAQTVTLAIMVVGVPLTTFLMLRRSYERDSRLTTFFSLWVQGIVIFCCGCLILALFQYIYFRLIAPTFMFDLFQNSEKAFREVPTPEGQEMAQMFHNAIERHMIPSPAQIAVMTMWSGMFTGSVLSAIIAGILKIKPYRYK